MNEHSFVVTGDEDGQRLDGLVHRECPPLSRREVQELFAEGRVRVDGKRVKKGDRARAGSQVSVELPVPSRAAPEPDAPLEVRLERPDLVVVAKPGGQPTAPRDGVECGTLANALVGHYPELAEIGHRALEPGLVHRLDSGTSGLLLAARSAPAFEHLAELISGGQLVKRYLALVEGWELASEGEIDLPIAPHVKNPRRVAVLERADGRAARPAVTRWRVLREVHEGLLVELDVSRAVRHQIRAHLAYLGAPIFGDVVYGSGPDARLGPAHALHASEITYAGDAVVPAFSVTCEAPPSWALFD
jgi:23S rRNA pseudouridine1911/1915/1917 synthase